MKLQILKYIIIFFLFWGVSKSYANSRKEIAENYLQLAWKYRPTSLDSAFKYASLALKIPSITDDMRIRANTFMFEYYLNEYDLINARHYLDITKPIALEPQRQIELLNCYSEWYLKNGKNDSAYYTLVKALDLAIKDNMLFLQAVGYNNLGKFYFTHDSQNLAIDNYLKSLKLWNKIDPNKTSGILSDIGNYYYYRHEFHKAIHYYRKALDVALKTTDNFSIGFSASNIGLAFQRLGELSKVEKYFKLAQENYLIANRVQGIIFSSINLGLFYQDINKFDEAHTYLNVAFTYLQKINDRDLWYDYYMSEASLAEKAKDYRQAAHFYKLCFNYQDSLIRLSPSIQMAEIESRTNLVEQKHENDLLKLQQARQEEMLQKQHLITGLIALLLLISVTSIYYVARTSKSRKKIIVQLRSQNMMIEKQNAELAELNVEMMIQRKKLNETLKFRDKLFSIVSHDVRSPLTSLQGLLELIADGEDIPKDMLNTMLRDVSERVSITTNFMDNLLLWARSQLEGYLPEHSLVVMHDIVSTIINLVGLPANEKDIKIENNICPTYAVFADQSLVNLIIRNLLTNAIKFTPQNGIIIIDAHLDNENIIISVKDNGVGMSKETLQKVMNGTGHTSLGTSNEKGTGLGLALCKDLIVRMHGQFWIESEPNEGSVFSFSLPLLNSKTIAA